MPRSSFRSFCLKILQRIYSDGKSLRFCLDKAMFPKSRSQRVREVALEMKGIVSTVWEMIYDYKVTGVNLE